MMNIGYIGMSHLGLNMAVGTALKGFNVLCFDPKKNLINNLRKKRIHIDEPYLKESIDKVEKKISFTNKIKELNKCDFVFIAIDINTDDLGNSDLTELKYLINIVNNSLKNSIPLILMSQVNPGFCQSININRDFYYQVETLIFGEAVKRATSPERIIIGSENEKISQKYLVFLKKFTEKIIVMNYQTAELCKVAINCFLISSVTTTNLLAEICEKIGADWSKISESLRLDRRIGKYAYLKPGMGISGGNLERDLKTVSNISKKVGSYEKIFNNWSENSNYRKNWVFEKLNFNLIKTRRQPLITVWGLTYKENTHSLKNSPSLKLLSKITKYKLNLFDPIIKKIYINGKCFYSLKSLNNTLINSDALCIMNASKMFEYINYKFFNKMNQKLIIDPLGILDKKKLPKQSKYIKMGEKC